MTGSSTWRDYLGDAFFELDDVLQAACQGNMRLQGEADVRLGNGLARLLCRVLGLPRAGTNVELTVADQQMPGGFLWQRRFAGHMLESRFAIEGDCLVETIGLMRLYLTAAVEDRALVYRLQRVYVLGLPLPGFMLPRLFAWAHGREGLYTFLLRVELPVVGLLFEQKGTLQLQTSMC
jgi:hypothetical protein